MADVSFITDTIQYIENNGIINADTIRYRYYLYRRYMAMISLYRPISTKL